MNAYFASFMLLLFNAVGLAVPAAAAEETSVTSGAEAAVSNICSEACSAKTNIQKENGRSISLPVSFEVPFALSSATIKPSWVLVDRNGEDGDKLEHEEGAP